MIPSILGSKIKQTQFFNSEGQRMPVTVIAAGPCWVTQIKTTDTDGYASVQLGFGQKSKLAKPQQGHLTKAGLEKQVPRFFREISVTPEQIADGKVKPGDMVTVSKVLQVGDVISITGTSKGKGFAGVVKRHQFRGGPATHGQSDRHRAPGSIGGNTTPGRVYRGKRMAGRMGSETVTVKNLLVISLDNDTNEIMVSGIVPGPKQGLLQITVMKRTEKPAVEEQPAAEVEVVVEKQPEEAPKEVSVEEKK